MDLLLSAGNSICFALEGSATLSYKVSLFFVTFQIPSNCRSRVETSESLCHLHIHPPPPRFMLVSLKASSLTRFTFRILEVLTGAEWSFRCMVCGVRGVYSLNIYLHGGWEAALGWKTRITTGSPAVPVRLSHRSESLMGRFSDGLDVLFHYAGYSLNPSGPKGLYIPWGEGVVHIS